MTGALAMSGRHEPTTARSSQGPVSKIVLQNIKVLANAEQRPSERRARRQFRQGLKLQVPPGQAEKWRSRPEGKLP